MDSKAAITHQPYYYTHHHRAPGHGCHASPSVVPWILPAGKTTGNRYDYMRQGPPGVFQLQPHYLCCTNYTDAVQCCLGHPPSPMSPRPTASWHRANSTAILAEPQPGGASLDGGSGLPHHRRYSRELTSRDTKSPPQPISFWED